VAAKIAIGMVVNNLDVGGLEKVVVSLLNNLDRDRFERHLISINGAGKMADEVDLPASSRLVLHKNPSRRIQILGVNVDTALFRPIRQFVRDKGIVVLHAHNLAPLIYAGIATRLLPMRNRPAVAYSEHNQIYSATPGQRRRFRWYIRLADEVVAVSQDLQRTLVDEVKAPRARVRVLYNGIDGKRFVLGDPTKVRRALGIADDEMVVGTAVVLSEQKGIRYLLEAAQKVLATGARIRFVIAGDGPLRPELEAQAAAAGLGDRVLFLGYRRDVPDLVSSYDAYVLPSLWEGLPLALIEALAIGKPVICTRVGGNPEIVEDGINGYVVAPRDSEALADRISRLYRDRGFAAGVGPRNVAKFKEFFSLEAMVDAHSRLFTELASAR
jgi:glycosyltransferase involved in cell wall biosynthesis